MPKPTLFRSAFPLDGGPTTPEQILAFHRQTFGGARMEADPAAPPAADPATPPAATPPAVPAPPAADATPPAAPAAWDGKVESLPDAAQKMIRDLRAESAERRTKLTAAEQAQQDAIRALAKAAGIDIPGIDAAPDPAQLAQELTTAQQASRQAAVELAVYKAAGKHSGDPVAILDSRAFLASVTDLDPNGSDFADKVDAAIKAAVDGNPKLKATAPAAGASTVQHAGGSGEAARTLDAQIEEARKAGKHELAISLQRQKAYNT
jgi:hypothetical protein